MSGKVYKCEAGHCVRVVIRNDDFVYVSSKFDDHNLVYTHDEWASFLIDVKNGKFDDWLEGRT